MTASELLDQAGKRLETELSSEPDIQADLLEAVARIDKRLGLDTAEDLAGARSRSGSAFFRRRRRPSAAASRASAR